MKQSRKRTLLMLVSLLVGGAIINVAVAWTIAWRSKRPMVVTMSHSFHVKNLNYWEVSRTDGIGIVLIHSRYGDPGHLSDSHGKQPSPPTFLLPAGSLIKDPRPNPSVSYFEWETLCGWPLLCFHGLVTSQDSKPHYGIKINAIGKIVPWRPLWPGFAINTIFYAAMIRGLWLLFAAPGYVRRRIRARRGQCPACAYPVGSSTVCTECGRPLKSRNAETQKAEMA